MRIAQNVNITSKTLWFEEKNGTSDLKQLENQSFAEVSELSK